MKEELIRRIPLFSFLAPEEARELASSLRLSQFDAGAILFLEGDPGDRFSIITEGEVEIIKAFGSTEERILAIEGPGGILGEVSLLYPDHLRSATARARTNVRTLDMTPQDFEQLIHKQVPLAVALLRELSRRLRRSESLTIRELQEKNRHLEQALEELRAAQEKLLEKERLEQELHLARKIQESMLPKALPELPGWQVTAYWQPAYAVGGDFYDFTSFPDGKLGVIIGDVTGKGMPAALIMATTRSLLHFAALNPIAGQAVAPGKILARVNEMSYQETPANMFITCLIAIVDPANGLVRYANAGHNLPYQCSLNGITELHARGMPLGMLPGMAYEENETVLKEGESLILFSDGLVEAHNSGREMYGALRLREQLAGLRGGEGLIPALLAGLSTFTGPDWEQEDDITCVVLKRTLDEAG